MPASSEIFAINSALFIIEFLKVYINKYRWFFIPIIFFSFFKKKEIAVSPQLKGFKVNRSFLIDKRREELKQ
jgi:hypothetical protein